MNTKTLGELIDLLEPLDQMINIRFDFCNFQPKGIISWRGIYAHLAITYEAQSFQKPMRVQDCLSMLKQADGSFYEGYKGGSYCMDRDTPVWVDNYGESTQTGIVTVSIFDYGGQAIIETARMHP